MNKNDYIIRSERKEEHREVENLVRESFWNVYRPGCLEHYVLNQLRNDNAFASMVRLISFNFIAKEKGQYRKICTDLYFFQYCIFSFEFRFVENN